jgi:glycosyltransferase involved in cell wall biosynthesis
VLAWQVSVFWTAMRPHVRRALSGGADVVSVEHDNAAHWIADLPAGIPSVLTLQNVGRHYYESRAGAATGIGAKLLGMEARRFTRYDARWLPRYDRLIAVSERDAEDLRADGLVNVDTVPNGVATDELAAKPPSDEPATVLFTGTLSHPPNAEGIRWFADEAWPLVRNEHPDARLLIVGREPPASVLELGARDGVEVVGPVDEMGPFFERATVAVAPLRSGGGTRLKILEAFASGRPVVSTTIGAEGLEVADRRELLLADSPAEFAAGVTELLREGELRSTLATAGRELAVSRYDWRVLGDSLAATFERAARPGTS